MMAYTLASTFRTLIAYHRLPRGVGTPRALSASAILRAFPVRDKTNDGGTIKPPIMADTCQWYAMARRRIGASLPNAVHPSFSEPRNRPQPKAAKGLLPCYPQRYPEIRNGDL